MENLLKVQEESNTTGKKIVINCQKRVKNATTIGWLETIQQLTTLNQSKRNMSNRRILSGILNKHTKVVVKIGRYQEEIYNEWFIYQKLNEFNIQNILPMYCVFTCLDDLNKYSGNQQQASMCQKTGEPIYALVMKYIPNPNVKMMDWVPNDLPILKSILQQVFCTLLDAYLKFGFVHGDMNLQNILLEIIDKPTRQKYQFGEYTIEIPIVKYQIQLMDFELSKINRPIEKFYLDLKIFLSKINYGLTIQLKVELLLYNIEQLYEKSENPMDLLYLIYQIDELKVVPGTNERPGERTYNPRI